MMIYLYLKSVPDALHFYFFVCLLIIKVPYTWVSEIENLKKQITYFFFFILSKTIPPIIVLLELWCSIYLIYTSPPFSFSYNYLTINDILKLIRCSLEPLDFKYLGHPWTANEQLEGLIEHKVS